MTHSTEKQLFEMNKNLKSTKCNKQWLQLRNELLKSIKYNANGSTIIFDDETGEGSFVHRGKAYYV